MAWQVPSKQRCREDVTMVLENHSGSITEFRYVGCILQAYNDDDLV